MKKEYTLAGLTCAACAGKIETEISALDKVQAVSVNVMTSLLSLTLCDDYKSDITGTIKSIVYEHEPDVVVIDKEEKHDDSCSCHARGVTYNQGSRAGKIIRIIIGALVFAAGVVTEHFFDWHIYIAATLFIVSYFILGGEVIYRALRNISKGRVFDEHFLMTVATVGAFAIGEFSEAVAVMLFYQVGEYIQNAAVHKSKKSITDLMDIRPDYANVKRNGAVTKVAPETVDIGELILVKPGEKIPLDGIIAEGEGALDTKSLTGESLPRPVKPGDTALSGCVSQNALLVIEVTKPYGESTVAKIIDLVENASEKKARAENFITKFSRYYTPVVVALAALLAVIPPLATGGSWHEWISRALVFLVISCPCGLIISIPLGFFAGIGSASRNGILFKGGNYLEALNDLDIIVFDKTGTLTKGVFEVTQIHGANGYSEAEVLEIAAYAESYSNHPIALSIGKAYNKTVEKDRLRDYTEIAGQGISVVLDGKKILAGSGKLIESESVSFDESDGIGTKVHIAREGVYVGCIEISDEIKPDSRDAIMGLKAKGVRKAVMLTGDSKKIAERIGKEISIDEVYAQLLPHEKVEKLELIDASKRPNGKLAFVGDGINDAPVLARADIGVAMGGLGSDAAIEAADVVLMNDNPSGLVTALEIAKSTRRIVWQNIIFALGIKAIVLSLGAFGLATMWAAVFADVGVALLAVLNSTRVLRAKYSRFSS